MALGIVASLLAVAGIIFGVIRHQRSVVVGSMIALIVIAAVWAFFWFTPLLTPARTPIAGYRASSPRPAWPSGTARGGRERPR